MDAQEARRLLAASCVEEPVGIPSSVLSALTIEDVTDGGAFCVGNQKDRVLALEWNGTVFREGDRLFGEVDHTWTRKYWYGPVGLEQYLDLIKRAVEARQRSRGDVAVTDSDDDGAYVILHFRVDTTETNLAKAYCAIKKVADEVEEAARQISDQVGARLAELASRLSGWGSEEASALVEVVETAKSADEKGRALEELCSRLFEAVDGLSITGRIKTETEEIDISVLNDSNDPRLRREGALILAECKNWTGRCGKNEFVIFKEKLENRSGRATLGFLVSWNGFATTVTKEMLRGSREAPLIVPVTGADIREAVRSGDFAGKLLACWDAATRV